VFIVFPRFRSCFIMPAISARQITNQDTQKPRASAPTKKRRVVKRRGRARGELDSDDEIEREAATDESDSEGDDSDSLDSPTDDSETEPVSEDATLHDRAHLPTPRTSKSPDSVGKGDTSHFFAPTSSWSEMVMDEAVNGAAELPVVDFADFGVPPLPKTNRPTRKPKKAPKTTSPPVSRATPAEPLEQPNTPAIEPTLPPASPADSKRFLQHRRQTLPGHSARQLYQQKLDSDPSFVPTIGNFWSHDDRLIDTELRNLSGWWRGRGTRGRGRREYNIRGRGEFLGHGAHDNSAIDEEVPPVNKTWTHDGFEEMKKKDEQRRAEQVAVRQAQSSPKRGGFAGRGRGNFMQGRGRGGYARGGFSSPARSRNDSPFTPGIRLRFAMKPELMWTKQHEAFLYFDSTLKPRPGQVPGFRVRLPGHQLQVIRLSSPASVPLEFPHKTTIAVLTDNYVVRLPKPVQEEKGVNVAEVNDRVDELSKDTSIANEDLAAMPGSEPSSPAPDLTTPPVRDVVENVQLEAVALESTPPETEAAEEELIPPPDLSSSDSPVISPFHERPVLPPLQTTFTPPPPPPAQPVSQPSPAYGSPFGYAMPLPPGIAMSSHGMPYELATGRPVYLQPPTMYTPRPIINSHYLHPSHMHHHSLSNTSPDFLAHSASHTPPINGFIDPATGTPIFSFPRQTSRIEIRAPGETPSPAGAKLTTKSPPPFTSTLRSTSASFQPAATRLNTETSDSTRYYLPSTTPSDTPLPSYEPQGSATMEDSAAPSTMMQHYYPQQYYYPEPYGYSQYIDMSHGGQTYQMYNMEQAQGTVYY